MTDPTEVQRLRQILWDLYGATGSDQDGQPAAPPPGVMRPDVPELAFQAVRETLAQMSNDYDTVERERDVANAIVARVRTLHTEHEGRCTECVEWCDCHGHRGILDDPVESTHGNVPWPCPTVVALDDDRG